MILKRLYNDQLAQASYLVGCPGVGQAVIIDPNRDVDQYIELAAQEGLQIVAVTETHIHADYLSGSRELAARTGAKLYLSDEGDADWKYAFAAESGATLVKDGDSFRVGAIRLDIVKTPGHTPEHISFIITDEAASSQPLGIFSGDFIFVGDVGRPDLLENAAGIQNTAKPGAEQLYRSLQRMAQFPDHLLVWPAHGAGSACGKSLGGVPVSSLGYERQSNWAFKLDSDQFVSEVLAGQPDPPKYFAMMKKLNKVGPAILGGLVEPTRLADGRQFEEIMSSGAIVVDIRQSHDYMESHVHGVLHIPAGSSFLNWAGWLIPFDADIYFIADHQDEVTASAKQLTLIGLDRVKGWFSPKSLRSRMTSKIGQISAAEIAEGVSNGSVLDVRNAMEWADGHIPGAIHIPLGRLPERAGQLSGTEKIFVHCQGGVRSPIATSVLERFGFSDVVNIADGYSGYSSLKRELSAT